MAADLARIPGLPERPVVQLLSARETQGYEIVQAVARRTQSCRSLAKA